MTTNPSPALPVPDAPAALTCLGAAVVCTLTGDLTTDNEFQLQHALDQAVEQAGELVAVDCANVSLFTSSAINALLTARRQAGEHGIALVLAAPTPQTLKVMEITGIDEVFPLYVTLDHALAHADPAA